MATDQQFDSTLERIVASLRAEMGSAFKRHAAEVAAQTAAERETAIRQATEAARRETQEQINQIRRSAQEQIDAAKRAAQAESAARGRAEAQVEDVRRIGRSQVEEAQRMMADKLSALGRELDESRREAAVRRQELDEARGSSGASLSDLVRGLNSVDEADSLTAVMHRLVDAAQTHSNGASILLVRRDGLKEWMNAGAKGRGGDKATAVATSAANEQRRVESEMAIAFPIEVGGEVVAVLHAEVGDALSPQRRIAKDALDALTRHAGRVLETLTLQQAAGLRPMGDRLP
jgi:hypothetical protein